MRYNFVELSTLNIALLGRQPKFCKNPFLPFIFLLFFTFFLVSFFYFWVFLFCFIFSLFFFLFDVLVKCFRFTQGDKVGVNLFQNRVFVVD